MGKCIAGAFLSNLNLLPFETIEILPTAVGNIIQKASKIVRFNKCL
jgi:hypothetical protein